MPRTFGGHELFVRKIRVVLSVLSPVYAMSSGSSNLHVQNADPITNRLGLGLVVLRPNL